MYICVFRCPLSDSLIRGQSAERADPRRRGRLLRLSDASQPPGDPSPVAIQVQGSAARPFERGRGEEQHAAAAERQQRSQGPLQVPGCQLGRGECQ